MLQTMRHLAQSWLFKGLMMILVVSFGIWGIGDIFRGNPQQRTVASVDGEKISVEALKRSFDKNLILMRRSFGPDLTEQQAKQLGLLEQTLKELIRSKQVELEIKRLGIDVTPQMAMDAIAATPSLRNPDGSFNKDLFQRVASQQGGEGAILADQQQNIARREIFYPLANVEKVPNFIVEAVTKARGQKRIFDVVSIANDSMRDVPAPDEKALHDFYEKNAQSFTAPEYRAITVAQLSMEDLVKEISISDDQLKKEYDAHIDQFADPERRDILQIIAPDEEKAKQVIAAARTSGNLPNAAHDAGYKTVPINGTEEKTLLPELAKPVFSMTVGQISEPLKSPLGWHVLQLKKITPPHTASFDEVKAQLRETMQKDQAADAATRAANQLDDELAAGHALEDIADGLKMRLIKISAIDANGKTTEGKDPTELPSKENVLKAAYSQAAGETSPIIDDKAGHYLVVRTDQVTPSTLRSYGSVKNQIVALWKTKEQEAHAVADAKKILKALNEGKAASSFAAQGGVEVRLSKPISLLGDNDSAIPNDLLPQLMKLKKGEAMTAPVPGHQLVLHLAQLVDLDAAAVKADHDKVSEQIVKQSKEELAAEYLAYLQTLFPSKINHDALEAMQQQGS